MKKILLTAFILIALLLCVSCTKKLTAVKMIPQITEYTMLIAGDASEFKDIVRNKIIEKYRPTCEIHVVNIEDLKTINTDDYDVVVIMDTCMAWSEFNMSVKAFLDKEKNQEKIVLSMTAGSQDWKFEYKDVDAITSASELNNQEFFFFQIDEEIQKIMSLEMVE